MKPKVLLTSLAGAFCTVALLLFSIGTKAAPTFSGNAQADFAGQPALVMVDSPANDVGMPSQVTFISNGVTTTIQAFAPGSLTGWNILTGFVEYDAGTDMLYVGVVCATICGDADGNGDAGTTGDILGKPVTEGGLGGQDIADLGEGESFAMLIDTNNDPSSYEVVAGVKESSSIVSPGVYNFLGLADTAGDALNEQDWDAALPNPLVFFGSPNASAPDLEFTIANFSTLPGFENGNVPQNISIIMAIGSFVDDGIGEDALTGSLEVLPTPTPETPTATQVITPTDTPTTPVTPTIPVTPTVPVTPTATVVETPVITPTVTPIPPTDVPTTGGDFTTFSASRKTAEMSSKPQAGNIARIAQQRPYRLQIPAIQLDAAIAEKGWHLVETKNGNQVSKWDDVENAVGWHKNSARPASRGNIVMSGHNNIGGSVFSNLYELKGGETIFVWQGNVRYAYVVDEIEILPEKYANAEQRAINSSYIQPTKDNRLTLITCWPPYSDSHRLFVIAHLDPSQISIDNRH